MKELKDLKELYREEIRKINKKGELTPTDAEAARKALEAIAMIDDLCCNEEDEWETKGNHYSERMYPHRSMNRYSMNRRMPEMSYEDRSYSDGWRDGVEYSDRRGRSATTGRYISRHAAPEVEGMIHKLENMRHDAPDEEIRGTIDRMIEKLENY